MHVGLDANKNLLILVFYVFVVGLWENKAGYYDLNSQGRETCHMMTKKTSILQIRNTTPHTYERKPEIFRLETIRNE